MTSLFFYDLFFLIYQEARALLGRIEYQKGNIEGALHVFEGIDIAAATPKMKAALASRKVERQRKRSNNFVSPPMSIHAVSLLFEAIFLKAKSLQGLRRYKGTYHFSCLRFRVLGFSFKYQYCFVIDLSSVLL